MIIEELTAKLGFEVEEHGKPLERVQEQLEGISKKLEFLGAVEILRGIYELAERFAGMGEKLEAAAVSAGITSEELQKLSFAAAQNAVSQDELSGALARLNRNLYNAKKGSESAIKSFAEVGIGQEQIKTFKNSEDALKAVSDAFSRMDDPIKKQAVAMELFGRGASNLVKLLSGGSESIEDFKKQAEEMGAVLSDERVESLAKLEDTFLSLFQIIKVFSATIASEFAPTITEAIRNLEKFWAANHAIIEINIHKWAGDMAFAFGFVTEIIRIAAVAVFDFIKAHPVLVGWAGKLALSLVGVSLALSAIQLVLGVIMGPIGKLISLFGFVAETGPKAFALVTRAVNVLRGALAVLLGVFEGMTAGAFVAWIASIGAVVLAAQALWEVLQGKSFWDTWMGQGIKAIIDYGGRAADIVKGIFGSKGDSATGKASTPEMESDPSDFVATGMPQYPWRMDLASMANTGQSGMQNLQAMAAMPQAAAPKFGVMSADTPVVYNMQQTNNISVPPGTDPKEVGPYIQKGIEKATDRHYREAHRGLQAAAVR